ncbi:DMT family transporter [Sphingomonas flavalba]|uniref:DMT family transporter n=1 Tax=Sphingomonas flavalba TaxID=2559804 RepID=UPI0039E16C84
MARAARWRPGVVVPFVLVTLIWGSTWLVIRDQLGVVPSSWSVTYRFAIAGVAMLGVALWRGESLRLAPGDIGFVMLLGVGQFALNYNLVYRAEQHVTSGLVAVVFALLLVPNAVLSRLFLGRRMARTFIIGSAVAIAGIVVLFAHEARMAATGSDAVLEGVALTLGAVLFASVANVMQATERGRALPMTVLLGWAMLGGAAIDSVVAYTTSGPPVIEMRAGYILGLLYLGVMASALAFALYYQLIRDIGPAAAAYTSVLIPVIAMALSTLFEGYRWSGPAVAGGLLTLAGLIIALSARSPERKSG